MTATKENTPTSPTVPSNSPCYCNKLIAWCRTHPIKAVIFIIVIAIVFVWIHGPFHKIHTISGGPNPVPLGSPRGN